MYVFAPFLRHSQRRCHGYVAQVPNSFSVTFVIGEELAGNFNEYLLRCFFLAK